MTVLIALLVGVLYGTGIYMMLRRSLVKLVAGLMLLANASNLLVFAGGGLVRGKPPLIAEGAMTAAADSADPLPQALVLTAIVISFGVTAFFLVLIKLAYQKAGADDLDHLGGSS